MSDGEERRALGGYDPDAGRNMHRANSPTLIPVPSLLRSLLSEHLDPGYAAAAAQRSAGAQPRSRLATAKKYIRLALSSSRTAYICYGARAIVTSRT